MASHPDSPSCTVAIVGAGFSGAAATWHLLRGAPPGCEIVLIEPAAELARGLAYSTPSDSHCLNVPAGRLGLDPADEPAFVAWMRAQGHAVEAPDFVPRRWLGAYVADELQRAAAAAAARGVVFRRVQARVDGVVRNRPPYRLRLSDGTSVAADQLILATGHFPPAAPPLSGPLDWDAAGMARDPWRGAALAGQPAEQDVLLVGTGLTAVDVVSQLRDDGHRGRIHLLSRRGLLPQPHRVHEARPPVGLQPVAELGDELRLGQILRAVHGWIAQTQADGGDWRDVMASLRPWTPHLWQRLCARDRRQFLRHLQPFWDTHRHRLAPAIHERLQAGLAAGDVVAHAGRLIGVERLPDGRLQARWRARGAAGTSTLTVGCIVNCTGPTASLARANDPLHASLRDAGVLSPDGLGQGLLVDALLRPIDSSGVPADGLHYVGPLLKAQRWEAIAIPELRVHAREVARHVLGAVIERCRQAA